MLLVLAAACGETKIIEVPGETVVVEKEVVKEVQLPGETVVVEKEVVKVVEVIKEVEVQGDDRYVTNVWGDLVERPRYGGTLPVAISLGAEGFDPWHTTGPMASYWGPMVLDRLGMIDWSLSRDRVPYLTSRFIDISHMTGGLAESWDITVDSGTYVFHIREGVKWHDKAPMNGRELTAQDIEWNFNRNLGLGKFASVGPSPNLGSLNNIPFVSVEATDKYTLKVEIENFNFTHIMTMIRDIPSGLIVPPEVVDQQGDMKGWEQLVGTGPFELTKFVPGSDLTYTRNPNYWKFDPLYPDLQNRLPYVDTVVQFVIRDPAALSAALRTGKIAMAGGKHLTLDIINNLRKTNPELVARELAGPQPGAAIMRADTPPFNDKNVRVAMQKAINREEINFAYYNGQANPTPFGYVTSFATDMWFPFDDLTDEVKWQYEFDQAAAEKLLDDAGYPRDSDGIRFAVKWQVVPQWLEDPDLAQLVTSYFDEIGVDVTVLEEPDESVFWNNLVDGDVERMSGGAVRHAQWNPMPAIGNDWAGEPAIQSGETNVAFNAQYAKIEGVTDREEYNAITKELDRMYLETHWTLAVVTVPLYMMHQPWLGNYRGEIGGAFEGYVHVVPNLWVDTEMKKEMGH